MGFLTPHFGSSKAEIWRQLSEQIGGRFVAGGFWQPDRIEARIQAWTVTLDTTTEPVGRASVTSTRLRASYINRDGFRFAIYHKSRFSQVARHFGLQDIPVGDPAFDAEFIIQGNDAQKLRALFADTLLKRLLAHQPAFHLEVKDDAGWFQAHFPAGVDELYLQVAGEISDLARLKALFDLFAELLDRLCRIGSALNFPSPYEGEG